MTGKSHLLILVNDFHVCWSWVSDAVCSLKIDHKKIKKTTVTYKYDTQQLILYQIHKKILYDSTFVFYWKQTFFLPFKKSNQI